MLTIGRQQYVRRLISIAFVAILGAVALIFLQKLILDKNSGIINFSEFDRLSIFSYHFNLRLLLSIIISPLVETFFLTLTMKFISRHTSDSICIYLTSALFWAALHGVGKGFFSMIPVFWLFIFLSKSAFEFGVGQRYSFFEPWLIHLLYNTIYLFIFVVKY
jgi:hypothetical protein